MDKPRHMILASNSPRRRDLLEAAGYTFDIVVSDVDEVTDANDPIQVAIENATRKARAVAANLSNDAVVIGADTIVVLERRIFGKPADARDARNMLRELSGRTHQVITGVCLVASGDEHTFEETTEVTFRELSDTEIDEYVATGEPLDKAGSYGIQGAGGRLVANIAGDYDNVVGLPIRRLADELDSLSYGDLPH